jgi:hypothetical protein
MRHFSPLFDRKRNKITERNVNAGDLEELKTLTT